MLNVYFGDMPGAIYNTAVYFKKTYRDEWITDDFGRSVIRDIDSSEVLSAQVIESPVLGSIIPLMLSGGVKTLLLVKHMRNQVFNASTCGDNCARWLLNIAQDRKVTVNLYHVMDFGEEEFKIRVLNSDKTVHTMTELIQESAEYL